MKFKHFFVSLVVLSIIVDCIKSEYPVFKIGETVQLDCSDGIEWLKTKEDQLDEKIVSSEKYTITQNNTLIITNVETNDLNINYICKKADSEISYYPITALMIDGMNNTQISLAAYSSGSTIVKCTLLMGYLNQNITWEWYFNDALINDTERIDIISFAENSTLKILQISDQESGAYTCLAINSIGQYSKTTFLKVKSLYDSILPILLAVIQVAIFTSAVLMLERMQNKRHSRF